jgi:hypothetical protein
VSHLALDKHSVLPQLVGVHLSLIHVLSPVLWPAKASRFCLCSRGQAGSTLTMFRRLENTKAQCELADQKFANCWALTIATFPNFSPGRDIATVIKTFPPPLKGLLFMACD